MMYDTSNIRHFNFNEYFVTKLTALKPNRFNTMRCSSYCWYVKSVIRHILSLNNRVGTMTPFSWGTAESQFSLFNLSKVQIFDRIS